MATQAERSALREKSECHQLYKIPLTLFEKAYVSEKELRKRLARHVDKACKKYVYVTDLCSQC